MGKKQTKISATTRINPLDCAHWTLRFYLYCTIFNCKSVASYATKVQNEIKICLQTTKEKISLISVKI